MACCRGTLNGGRFAHYFAQLGNHFPLPFHLLARVRYEVHEKDTRYLKLA